MSMLRLFLLSFLITTGGLLTAFYVNRPKTSDAVPPKLIEVAKDVYITSQLDTKHLRGLRRSYIRTVIDIRPDGEASDQTPSTEIEQESKRNGLDFHYIPVPHEGIPEAAVAQLGAVLTPQAPAAVLYCRTGRRAVRLFAMVQASRLDGPNIDSILDMVHKAGFTADDLRSEIAQRISDRNNPPEIKQ